MPGLLLSHFKRFASTSVISSSNRLSTVEAGTKYELFVLETLNRYGFNLARRGGPNDKGVDLSGYVMDVPIIIQCKFYDSYITPSVLRELLGVVSLSGEANCVGFLVCNGGLKEGSLSFLQSAVLPMGVMTLLMDQEDGDINRPSSLSLNQPARALLPFLRQKSVYYRNKNGYHVKGIDLVLCND